MIRRVAIAALLGGALASGCGGSELEIVPPTESVIAYSDQILHVENALNLEILVPYYVPHYLQRAPYIDPSGSGVNLSFASEEEEDGIPLYMLFVIQSERRCVDCPTVTPAAGAIETELGVASVFTTVGDRAITESLRLQTADKTVQVELRWITPAAGDPDEARRLHEDALRVLESLAPLH